MEVGKTSVSMSRSTQCTTAGDALPFQHDVWSLDIFSPDRVFCCGRFDSVMFMDTDNFALRDPSYLFDTPEFKKTGALFWPDYWSPGNTIFNLGKSSFVWELTGLPFVDMFEQESGQIVIDRRRHAAALDILMFYARPDNIMYRYGAVYGDKDLFRLAWMRAGKPFHMIEHPPGWAGQVKAVGFCGLTMVQYGPEGNVLFLHRNAFKLDSDPASRQRIWDGVVQWTGGKDKRYFAPEWLPRRKRWGYKNGVCYGPRREADMYMRDEGPLLEEVRAMEYSILKYAFDAVEMSKAD